MRLWQLRNNEKNGLRYLLERLQFWIFFFIYFIPSQPVFFPVKFPFPYFQMTQNLSSFFGEHCHISSWFLHFSPRESPRKGEGTVITAEVKIECLRAGQSHTIAQLKEEIDYVELQYTGRIIYESLSLDQKSTRLLIEGVTFSQICLNRASQILKNSRSRHFLILLIFEY